MQIRCGCADNIVHVRNRVRNGSLKMGRGKGLGAGLLCRFNILDRFDLFVFDVCIWMFYFYIIVIETGF